MFCMMRASVPSLHSVYQRQMVVSKCSNVLVKSQVVSPLRGFSILSFYVVAYDGKYSISR